MLFNARQPKTLVEDGVTFTLTPLPGQVSSYLSELQLDVAKAELSADEPWMPGGFSSLMWDYLRFGLTGWDGVEDAEGNPVPPVFDTITLGTMKVRRLSDQSMDLFVGRETLATKLGLEILKLSQLTLEEKKASGASSTAPSSPSRSRGGKSRSRVKDARSK